MPQATIVFNPGSGIAAADVAEAWAGDAEAAALLAESAVPYPAQVRPEGYGIEPMQAVVLPLAVSVTADLLVLITERVVDKVLAARSERRAEQEKRKFKVDALPAGGEDQIIAVTDEKAG